MIDAYIYDAVRTPRGKGRPDGALSGLMPHDLVVQLIDGIGDRNGPDTLAAIARLLLGCVGQVGAQGGHIALVSRIASALVDDVAVKSINNYCVSGLSAANEGVLWARAGAGGLTLAGGVEMLSQVPFLADKAAYYSDPGVARALNWAPPIMGAELTATLENFTKTELDEITLRSHQRAASAWSEGRFADLVLPVLDMSGETLLQQDELVRSALTMEKLSEKAPAFAEEGAKGYDAIMLDAFPELDAISHVHSVANCPGMADGAALVLLGSRQAGRKADLRPRARVIAIAEAAGDPVLQFSAGFSAMEQALQKAGLNLAQLDLIEFMEAFAVVPLKFERNYDVDPGIVNVNGGHLAMGHPMGATGAILVASLLHELERRDANTGMVVAHAGGGIGAAMIIERT